MNALQTITDDVYSVREQFLSVCDNPAVFEREAGFAVQLLGANEYAMRIATENRQSVVNAVANIAAIGISLNPARKQAYLVPRDGRICLDISYMGLLDLAIASGSIKWGQAEIVYTADRFELNGFDKPPTHARDPFNKDRGEMVGAYVVVKTADGDYLTTTMPISEVFDIRDRSAAWKAWINKQKKCPWVTDEGEMVKKTVIKRAYKLWPKTERLDTAVHYLNTEGGEGLAELAQNDAPPQKSSVHKPTAGAMESLSPEQQEYIRQVSVDVLEAFEMAGAEQALIRCEIEEFDADRTVALWSLLPSNVRSAIKRAKQDRAKAAA
jgi:recombination protein RecT